MNGDVGRWQVFESTEKKRECERISKQELCRKKKTARSFEGFSDISRVSTMDKMPAGLSVPLVSTSCNNAEATVGTVDTSWVHRSDSY